MIGNFRISVSSTGIVAATLLCTAVPAMADHANYSPTFATSDSPSTMARSDLYTGSGYHTDPNELATGHVPDLPPSRTEIGRAHV